MSFNISNYKINSNYYKSKNIPTIEGLSIVSKIEEKYKINNILKMVISKSIVKYCIYYKNLSFKYIEDIENKNKNKSIPNILNSSSSSIIKAPNDNETFIINIRCVNYYLDKNGNSSLDGRNSNSYTSNIIIYTDKYFNILNRKIFNPLIEEIPHIGIEDIRLFNFKNTIYFIGSSYDKKSSSVKIVSDKFDPVIDNSYNCKFIVPSFKTNFNWEKNWVFFENDDDMYIIYKWNPIYICKIDYHSNILNLVKEIKTPEIFKDFRGSTNGVHYNDKIWFIIHSQIEIYTKKSYYHRFVVLNKDMTINGYSNMFKFENYLVEFCIGLTISNNQFVIMYSTLDKTSKIAIFSGEFVNNLITNLI